MMSDALDRVLEALDVGLQVPPEVMLPSDVDHDDDLCVRCCWQDREQGELCGGCRTWLLGDSDVDPIDVNMGGPIPPGPVPPIPPAPAPPVPHGWYPLSPYPPVRGVPRATECVGNP